MRFAARESIRLFRAGRTVVEAAAAVGESPATVARWIATSGDYVPPPATGGLHPPTGPADEALRARWPSYHRALDGHLRTAEIEALEAECDACEHDAAMLERAGMIADARALRARVLPMARRIEALVEFDRSTAQDW